MSEAKGQFRGSMSGFNRQDVLDYVAAANQEFVAKQTELNQELERVSQENAALQTRTEQAEAAAEQSRQDREALSRQMEALQSRLDAAESERDRLLVELDTLRVQLPELTAQLESQRAASEKFRADSEAYQRVKEKAGVIELAAYDRAKTILDGAEELERDTRQRMAQWAVRTQENFSRLRSEINAASSRASHELDRARQMLEQLPREFDGQEELLKALSNPDLKPDGEVGPDPSEK